MTGKIEIVTAGTDAGVNGIAVGPAPTLNTGSLVARILAGTVAILKVLLNLDFTSDTPVVALVDASATDATIADGATGFVYTIDDPTKKASTFTAVAMDVGNGGLTDVSAAVKPTMSLQTLVNAIEADLKSISGQTSGQILVDQAAGTVTVVTAPATVTGLTGALSKIAIEKAVVASDVSTFE